MHLQWYWCLLFEANSLLVENHVLASPDIVCQAYFLAVVFSETLHCWEHMHIGLVNVMFSDFRAHRLADRANLVASLDESLSLVKESCELFLIFDREWL